MFILIDNTKDLRSAAMTPLIIQHFKNKSILLTVVQTLEQLYHIDHQDIQGIILSDGPLLLSKKTEISRYSKNVTVLIAF